MKNKIIQQGAEAIIILKKNQILKNRVSKSYRIQELDEKIRKLRTRNETRLIEKARKIILVPKVLKVDENKKEILMEFIDGKKLSEHLDKFHLKKQKEICMEIGKNIAKLHNVGIIHGDLTTSNMIYVSEDKKNIVNVKNTFKKYSIEGNNENKNKIGILNSKRGDNSSGGWAGKPSSQNFRVFFIDFGLAFHSHKYEDKAVDIHLIKQALEAKHFKNWQILYKSFLDGYSKESKEEKLVLKQLEKVEKRGRYRH